MVFRAHSMPSELERVHEGGADTNAMAQAAGGTYGVSHGAMNALCLAPAMRFNAETVPHAMTAVPVERVEQLARLGGFERLRDYSPDDNYKFIDWRSTARRGKLTVKEVLARPPAEAELLLGADTYAKFTKTTAVFSIKTTAR